MPMTRRRKWLVIVLIAVALATCYVFLRPAEYGVRRMIYRSQCMGNLRTLGQFVCLYADNHQQWLPVAEGGSSRAHESLQVLIDAVSADETFDPEILVCPGSRETKAEPGSDGRVRLTEKNVSYAWRAKPLRATGTGRSRTVLACEKTFENHAGSVPGINVLYIDGAVKFVSKEDLGADGVDGFIARNELSK
jgi:hypothetical protein